MLGAQISEGSPGPQKTGFVLRDRSGPAAVPERGALLDRPLLLEMAASTLDSTATPSWCWWRRSGSLVCLPSLCWLAGL
jgi:hypothetical protein